MKETDKAVIQFLGYRVSEISYTCPVTLEFPSDAKISCNMNFSKALGRISETRVQEKLRVNLWHTIGDQNTDYKISVEINGQFEINEHWDPAWETNMLAILFPYLRSIVSTVTSMTGREPIIIPTINIANAFRSESDKKIDIKEDFIVDNVFQSINDKYWIFIFCDIIIFLIIVFCCILLNKIVKYIQKVRNKE